MYKQTPYSCQATGAGQRFYDLIRTGMPAGDSSCGGPGFRVHSVFRRVVNFSWQDGYLSLVCPGVGNDSSFLVVDLPENVGFLTLGMEPGMPVTLAHGSLLVSDAVAVNCLQLQLWQGRASGDLLWSGKNVSWQNLLALREAICRWGVQGGLGDTVCRPDHPMAARINSLAKALADPGEDGCRPELIDLEGAVKGIVGYGPGLTPSGDDLLLGVLAAAGTGVDYQPRRGELHRAITNNLRRTNELSAFFLRRAMAGDYHEYVQELVYAVARELPGNVTAAARTLLGMGATSGTDIATGIYLGFS